MKILTHCPHMIPAERCLVVIFPSMAVRERAEHPTNELGEALAVTSPLEAHGVDEVACGWEGNLPVTGYETTNSFHAEGDCPRCGQVIVIRGTD